MRRGAVAAAPPAPPAAAAPAGAVGDLRLDPQTGELSLKTPKPMFVGTPVPAKVPNLEPAGTPQPRMRLVEEAKSGKANAESAPAGTKSDADTRMTTTAHSVQPSILELVTTKMDPDSDAASRGDFVAMGSGGGAADGLSQDSYALRRIDAARRAVRESGAGVAADGKDKASGPGSAAASAPDESQLARANFERRSSLPRAPAKPEIAPRDVQTAFKPGLRELPDTAVDHFAVRSEKTSSPTSRKSGISGDTAAAKSEIAGREQQAAPDPGRPTVAFQFFGAPSEPQPEPAESLSKVAEPLDRSVPAAAKGKDMMERAFPVTILGMVDSDNGRITDEKAVFEKLLDRKLPSETSIHFDKASGHMIVRADPGTMKQLTEQMESSGIDPRDIPPVRPQDFRAKIESPDGRFSREAKAKREEAGAMFRGAIIPTLEFRQTPVTVVIASLNKALQESGPDGRNLQVVMKGMQDDSDNRTQAEMQPPITLSLRKVTALDALRYVTDVAGLKYRIEGERAIVSPISVPNEPMVVKAVKCNPADWVEKGRPSDEETRKFLVDMGVPFPPVAGLHYDANTSLLTVTNTEENHDIADRIIEALEADAQWKRQQPATKPAEFNPVVETAENAFSTFSIDVDTAAYSMARRAILDGKRPAPESVRTEEFVNAFDYDYAPPAKGAFAIHVDGAPSPFRTSMDVLRIGIKGRRIGRDRHVPSNLTLVIDTSGSMQTDDRIGLIRRSLRMLVGQLDPEDRVAVVQFGSKAALRLEPTPAAQKDEILKVIDSLETAGSTQLEGGLKLGYEVAAKAFRSGASNRVILMSDGVANLGATEAAGILATVEAHRRQGVRLTVLGFGSGAYDDAMLENLADKGDGAYTFIDSEDEAKRVLVDNLAATLHTIASDVKIQVEFNPRSVRNWRQLGYENRALTREQFRDDTVDAGEVGSGQSVTALYDVKIEGPASEWIGTVRVRYRDLETGRIEEIERRITSGDFTRDFAAASPRFRLAAGIAEFAELLRLSPHTFSQGRELADAIRVLRPVALELSIDPQVQELVRLAQAAQSLPN
ncbi:MAG: von Willebrand factor type A domain-containing protein, partial [Verrucomicrobia bacterium]|nr:von Willebrand factor type A domain-containing protein [Verrucomicrobiota bacterium]